MKIIVIDNSDILPKEIVTQAISPIIVMRHPIFEEYVGLYEDVVVPYRDDGFTIDDAMTERSLRNTLKGRLDFMDSLRSEEHTSELQSQR